MLCYIHRLVKLSETEFIKNGCFVWNIIDGTSKTVQNGKYTSFQHKHKTRRWNAENAQAHRETKSVSHILPIQNQHMFFFFFVDDHETPQSIYLMPAWRVGYDLFTRKVQG